MKSRDCCYQGRKTDRGPTGASGRLPVATEIRRAPRFYDGRIRQRGIGRSGSRFAWRLWPQPTLIFSDVAGSRGSGSLKSIRSVCWIDCGRAQDERWYKHRVPPPKKAIHNFHYDSASSANNRLLFGKRIKREFVPEGAAA